MNGQSKKLYHKKLIETNQQIQYFYIVIMETVSISIKHRNQTFKATQFQVKHCDKAHECVELKEEYFKIFSVWKVDYEKKTYLQQYIHGMKRKHILRYGTDANTIDIYKALPTDKAWPLKSLQVSLQFANIIEYCRASV